jgi:hypothetical protein
MISFHGKLAIVLGFIIFSYEKGVVKTVCHYLLMMAANGFFWVSSP